MNSREYKYYRDAVENHWDPKNINFSEDIEGMKKLASDDFFDGVGFDIIRKGLAMFGAGEKDVTDELSPLAVKLEDIESQMFITTQLYEEAKHSDFFEMYWSDVINKVEKDLGYETTTPSDNAFFADEYDKIFNKNKKAVENLLYNNDPKDFVNAYSHYHLIIEGVLAQTGYWAFQETLGKENKETPNLPALMEGFTKIRGDESRHVGFGLHKIKSHMREDEVSMDVVNSTAKDLLPLINKVFLYIWEDLENPEDYPAVTPEETLSYIQGEHSSRMKQVENAASRE